MFAYCIGAPLSAEPKPNLNRVVHPLSLRKWESIRRQVPFDIVSSGPDSYRITLAVPGFAECDLDLQETGDQLVVKGRRFHEDGSSLAAFNEAFRLPEYTKVARAKLANGLLHIWLERDLPAALRPRKIPVFVSRRPTALQKLRQLLGRAMAKFTHSTAV